MLRKYQKVKSFSISLTDEAKKPLTEEPRVDREDFKNFIVQSGAERIIGYIIVSVNSYSEGGKTIETPEAKQKQKQNTVSKRQLDLFG